MDEIVIKPVAHVHTEFREKFGIPRQSSIVPGLKGEVVFVPPYNNPAAIKGIEGYSHLWLIWGFSESVRENVSLTVHPPRLGGKEKRGVFATRAPYRPNPIGLSSVKLEKIIYDEKTGPHLLISGVDMLDGSPVYDIKPYMPYSDDHPDARGGFGEKHKDYKITVIFDDELKRILPAEQRPVVTALLEQDPRAAYQKEPGFIYGMSYAGYDIRFLADVDKITVTEVIKTDENTKQVK